LAKIPRKVAIGESASHGGSHGKQSNSSFALFLAPCAFFRFGHIKRKLTEYNIPDRHSLQKAITHICDEIGQETLIAVFETWINRLEWMTEYEEEYFHT
jgi:hypothetical protein